ncbi:nSTAND1 domain-containing NTPase [Nonomuraea rubra]
MNAERRAGRPEGAIDPDAGPVERLAWELRRLRREAGAPGYRVLAKRAHYSSSTLAEAAQGRRLPTLEVTLAYVEACGGNREEWTARWQAAAGLVSSATPPLAGEDCPYLGLAAFHERDADWFFGRGELVAALTRQVADGPGLTAVFGASGSGKSSLVRAGLMPALPLEWRAVVLTPAEHPLTELATVLAPLIGANPATLAKRLAEDPGAVWPPAGDPDDGGNGEPAESRPLLVIDQFEETFTLCADAAEREAFIRAVVRAAQVGLRVVIVVRADFYAHCSAVPELVAALREGTQVPIGAPGEAELRDIITGPATKADVAVDDDLVSTLIADAADRPGALPLLSHALRETWRRREGPVLRLADYRAGGGVRGSIAQAAEAIYLGGDAARRRAMRTVFLRLTALGEGTEDTRRRVARTELSGVGPASGMDDLLEELARARLIVLDRETVEVAHEAVISAWPRLRDWLLDGRADLRLHRDLTRAATTWQELGHDRGALLRGGHLAAVRNWADRRPEDLNDLEAEFLAASTAAERRRGRLARQLVAAMAVLLVLAVTAAVTAVRAQDTARDQRDVALSEKVAGEAAALRGTDPTLAAQLSLAAYRLAPTVAARGSLLSGAAAPLATKLPYEMNTMVFFADGRLMAAGGDDRTIRLWDVSAPHRPALVAALPGQPEDVESIAVTGDGRTMVSATYDGTVRFWDLSDPRRPRPAGAFAAHREAVFRVRLTPDGRTLATSSADGTVRLWDIGRPTAPERVAELAGHAAGVTVADLSRDGRTLATGGVDGGTRIWDVRDPRRPVQLAALPGRAQQVTAVAFAPDGRTLAAAGFDHETRLWDLSDPAEPEPLTTLEGNTGPVQAVAFSSDGRMVATGGWDYTVRVWDVADRRRPVPHSVRTGHTNTVWEVAFDPAGRILASAGGGRDGLLTDLPGPVLAGHGGALSTLALSPDGRTAVVGSEDFTARLWDVSDPRHPVPLSDLPGHTAQVKSVVFSRSGRFVATGSIDTRVRLWDVTDPRRPRPLRPIETGGNVRAVAFMPGDTLIATGGGDRPGVRLWNLPGSRPSGRPAEPAGEIKENMNAMTLAFSPRGRLLADSQDHDVHLWDVTDPARPRRLAAFSAHPNTVQHLNFSPDGRTLATAGLDGTARLWDVADPARPRPVATLTGHVGGVQSVAFAPTGRMLATAGLDGTARLWDLTPRPALRAVLTGHTDRVHAAAFAPTGHTLITSSEDRTARLWPTDPSQAATRICTLTASALTPATWTRYFPDLTHRPPCGPTP